MKKKFAEQPFALLLIPIAAMWVIEIIDSFFLGQKLNSFGIIPRDRSGLIGIPLSPFLHGGFGHLISNTVPLLVLGSLVLLSSTKQFLQVTATIILLGGLGVWAFAIGRNECHIGASGVVFGYFGYLVVRGYFERTIPSLVVAAIVIFMYGGGMVFGMLPVTPGVSWEGHLFGFLAGAFAARSMAYENIRAKTTVVSLTGNQQNSLASVRKTIVKQRGFLRLTSAFLIALLLVTGPLWFGGHQFPIVPLFGGLWAAPTVQRLASMLTVICLAVMCLFAGRHHIRLALVMVIAGLLCGLVQLDQHRLQPWLLHLLAVIVVLAIQQPRNINSAIRWMTAGIYFHSAVSKIDFDFLTGGGFYLVKAIGNVVSINPDGWPEWLRFSSTALLPAFELAVAALLMSRYKRAGWMMSILMHLGLLTALIQMNHKPGVLLWNAWFIVQAVHFLITDHADSKKSNAAFGNRQHAATLVALSVFWILPFLNYEPIRLWDNWPSWSLYSTRSERISVFVHENAKSRLPAAMQKYIGPPSPFLCRVKIDRWSLAETNSPVYPEDRFGIGVALQLSEQAGSGPNDFVEAIHVHIESAADRFSGKRKSIKLSGRQQLTDRANRFWLNAIPATPDAR